MTAILVHIHCVNVHVHTLVHVCCTCRVHESTISKIEIGIDFILQKHTNSLELHVHVHV